MINPSGREGRRESAAAHLLGLRVRNRPEHRCLSLVTVVYCQMEVSVSGRSLVQRSPTVCGVSECDRETSVREVLSAKIGRSNTGNKHFINTLTRNVSE